MWKLISIHAEGLCAFRELDYTLTQGVTTLIFGHNMDNDSQKSNGSGKSALVEAVALGITGSPLRRIKNEEIINDSADNCQVILHFRNDASDENFFIERQLSRKGPASVGCRMVRNGVTVTTDEAVHPTVDAYNKYILDKLGITKDELYNNFILSKHKYQDFLSSSDKDKKDIINRFSNAVLVDKAIEKVLEDRLPAESNFREAELSMAGMDGRIDMLTEQIRKEENLIEEKKRTRAERVQDIKESISNKRASIRQNQEEIKRTEQVVSLLENADKQVQYLENTNGLLMENCLSELRTVLSPHIEEGLTSWEEVIAQKKKEVQKQEVELKIWDEAIIGTETEITRIQTDYEKLQKEYDAFSNSYPDRVIQYDKQLEGIGTQLGSLTIKSGQLKKERQTLLNAIENIKAKLAGTISCPACRYEFILSDATFDVMTTKKELEEKEKSGKGLNTELYKCQQNMENIEMSENTLKSKRRSLMSEHSQWSDRVMASEALVKSTLQKIENQQASRRRVKDAINFIQEDINTIKNRVFDEAFERIDSTYRSKKKKISNLEQDIQAANSAINALTGMLDDLAKTSGSDVILTLRSSLKEYRQKSSDISTVKIGFEKQLQKYEEQLQLFLQFKSYLANTKIEALSKVTNEFLESIDSDIRVKFNGYTVLKSGKVREKISISLLRNGINCGSFDKFSEGEKARVNLANILAMNKLVNSAAEDGKGIDILILDEILAAVDENGLACIFLALSHVGITSLVISHGNIAENYPHRLIINKHNAESYIHENN